ncbi:MAG TPA: hypothetical protein VEX35_08240 [Allosphingosinicella sp.]|nr:hypothetical protein [Allosphingosinicella sp.]
MRVLTLVLLAVSAVTTAPPSRNGPSLNSSERQLFERLEGVVASGRPTASEIVRAFGLPPECARRSCFFEQSQVVSHGFTGGDLRPAEDGLVFVLERPTGQCIRVDRAIAYFGAGEPRESCSHGGCWYVKARHRWGILGFGLEAPGATCVASVVINSLPYQRPRDDDAR